jgi:hypothetical protein
MKRDKKPPTATADRRAFLATAGKFAAVTPPAMTMLLSTTLTSPAIAASGLGGNAGGKLPKDPKPPKPPKPPKGKG